MGLFFALALVIYKFFSLADFAARSDLPAEVHNRLQRVLQYQQRAMIYGFICELVCFPTLIMNVFFGYESLFRSLISCFAYWSFLINGYQNNMEFKRFIWAIGGIIDQTVAQS